MQRVQFTLIYTKTQQIAFQQHHCVLVKKVLVDQFKIRKYGGYVLCQTFHLFHTRMVNS